MRRRPRFLTDEDRRIHLDRLWRRYQRAALHASRAEREMLRWKRRMEKLRQQMDEIDDPASST